MNVLNIMSIFYQALGLVNLRFAFSEGPVGKGSWEENRRRPLAAKAML